MLGGRVSMSNQMADGGKSLTNVGIIAVQNGLVTTPVLTDGCKSLDDTQTELLPLLAFVYCDILDVTHASKSSEKLALDEYSAYSNDLVAGLVEDDDGIVGVRRLPHGVELVDPSSLSKVVDDG